MLSTPVAVKLRANPNYQGHAVSERDTDKGLVWNVVFLDREPKTFDEQDEGQVGEIREYPLEDLIPTDIPGVTDANFDEELNEDLLQSAETLLECFPADPSQFDKEAFAEALKDLKAQVDAINAVI